MSETHLCIKTNSLQCYPAKQTARRIKWPSQRVMSQQHANNLNFDSSLFEMGNKSTKMVFCRLLHQYLDRPVCAPLRLLTVSAWRNALVTQYNLGTIIDSGLNFDTNCEDSCVRQDTSAGTVQGNWLKMLTRLLRLGSIALWSNLFNFLFTAMLWKSTSKSNGLVRKWTATGEFGVTLHSSAAEIRSKHNPLHPFNYHFKNLPST